MDVPGLLLELTHSLPAVSWLTTQTAIDNFNRSLRQAVTDALNNNSPNKAPPGKNRPWWRPEILDPLRQEANQLHRTFKNNKSEENKLNYTKAHNVFNRKVDKMKEDSWKTYLSTLTHDTLFQAKRFASGRKPSSLVNTLVSKEGTVCSTNEQKADLLFETTCVATAPCNIPEAEILNFPLDPSRRSRNYSPTYPKKTSKR